MLKSNEILQFSTNTILQVLMFEIIFDIKLDCHFFYTQHIRNQHAFSLYSFRRISSFNANVTDQKRQISSSKLKNDATFSLVLERTQLQLIQNELVSDDKTRIRAGPLTSVPSGKSTCQRKPAV